MTDEEIKALEDAKAEAERLAEDARKQAEEAQQQAQKAKEDLMGVVDELKEERRKKAEALEKAKITNKEEPEDITTAVERALAEKEAERRRRELESAIEQFKSSKTEFKNDETGLVFERFKQSLDMFNLEKIDSKEQALDILEKAYKLEKQNSGVEDDSGYEGTPSGVSPAPTSTDPNDGRVEQLAEGTGVPKDRLKELKEKYRDAFSGLGIE